MNPSATLEPKVSGQISSIAAGVTARPSFGGSVGGSVGASLGGSIGVSPALQSLSSLSAYVPPSNQPDLAALFSRVSAAGPKATTDPSIQSAIRSIYAQASPALSSAASYKSGTLAASQIASLLSGGAAPANARITSDVRAISSALAAVKATGTLDPVLSTAVSNLLVGATGAVSGQVVAQQSALSAALASVTVSAAQASARAQSALQGAQSSLWAPILSGASSVGAQASSLSVSGVASAVSKLVGGINSAIKLNLPAQSSAANVVASYIDPALPTSTPFINGGPSGFQTSYRPTTTVGGSVGTSAAATQAGSSSLPSSPECAEISTIADTINAIEFCGRILTCDAGVFAKGNPVVTVDTTGANCVKTINFCGSTLRCGDNGPEKINTTLSVVASSDVDVSV